VKLRKGCLKTNEVSFQAACIDGIFEWQLAQNETSTELKSSLHIGLF